jgi:RNA polymerase sigma factor (sigma-70 family)
MYRGIEMPDRDDIGVFERTRPNLMGLAYRILGSRADAEDAVQDTFLKWRQADIRQIDNPAAWLTTICTRRCLDLLRAAHRSRVTYVGAWLPEPIHTPVDDDAEGKRSSLTTAFLLLLERLTPKERAAYLLHEIFDVAYPEIAATLEMQESACRKLVSRAKASVDQAKVRQTIPLARQDALLAAFQSAIASGATAELAALLSDEVKLTADGGGKAAAIREVLHGKAAVMAFLTGVLRRFWTALDWIPADINGGRGAILRQDGATIATLSFGYDEAGKASDVYIMRNPDKLARLDGEAIH